jgi:TRAP-type uncharacterized transport system substrate-binding protein
MRGLFYRLRKERVYWLSALGLALIGLLAGLGYWYFVSPTRLKVAVGPRDSAEARLVRSYADALAERRRDIRLTLVDFDDVRQSAEALRQGKVDLAIVRPDVLLPGNGLTVAILREEAVIVVAPAASKIEGFSGLAGKRLGIVTHHEADLPVVTAIAAHYDLGPPAMALVPLTLEEVEAAFTAKRIDALAFVAAPVGQEAANVMRVAFKALGGKPSLVPIAESQALALKSPNLSEATIPVGSLGGRPRLPAEEVKTIGVSYRLMARQEVNRNAVSKVAQYLFQMRSRIAQTAPSVNLLKAPDTETSTSATLPNHPGAVDYFNREQLTFMDQYGDWLWLGVFAAGGFSSGIAWVAQLFVRKRRELVDQVLDRLLLILSDARESKTVHDLKELSAEIDGLVIHAVRHMRRRTAGSRMMSTLILALDSARAAIEERRRDLLDELPPVSRDQPPAPVAARRIGAVEG